MTFGARYAALSSRERRLLAAGAAAVLLFLLYMMLRSDGGGEGGVELAATPPPAMPAPTAAAPTPTPTVTTAQPPAAMIGPAYSAPRTVTPPPQSAPTANGDMGANNPFLVYAQTHRPTAQPPPPPPALGSIPGVALKGVFAGGPGGGAAIVAAQDGAQRLVRIGRPVAPGMILTAVGPDYALVSTPSGEARLTLAPPAATVP